MAPPAWPQAALRAVWTADGCAWPSPTPSASPSGAESSLSSRVRDAAPPALLAPYGSTPDGGNGQRPVLHLGSPAVAPMSADMPRRPSLFFTRCLCASATAHALKKWFTSAQNFTVYEGLQYMSVCWSPTFLRGGSSTFPRWGSSRPRQAVWPAANLTLVPAAGTHCPLRDTGAPLQVEARPQGLVRWALQLAFLGSPGRARSEVIPAGTQWLLTTGWGGWGLAVYGQSCEEREPL